MFRIISFTFALAFAAPAWAGSLSLSATTGSTSCPTVTAPAGGTTATRCISGSDAQLARLIEAYAAIVGLDAGATNAQKFTAFAQRLFDEIKAAVRSYEQNQARISAESGVSPVGMQ